MDLKPAESTARPPAPATPLISRRSVQAAAALVGVAVVAAVAYLYLDKQAEAAAAQDQARQQERIRDERARAAAAAQAEVQSADTSFTTISDPTVAEARVLSFGNLVVEGTGRYDLVEGGNTTDPRRADLWWEQVDRTKRFLVPQNGAMFALLGKRDYEAVLPPVLRRLQMSADKIDGSDQASNQIPVGTVVGYKTKEGRFGKFIVESNGFNLRIRWTTYTDSP